MQKDQPYTYNESYSNNTLKPPNADESDLLQSKNSSVPYSISSANSTQNFNINTQINTKIGTNTNADSLFTSPQLLAECRNFLKLKSSAKPSVEKDFTNNSKINIEH